MWRYRPDPAHRLRISGARETQKVLGLVTQLTEVRSARQLWHNASSGARVRVQAQQKMFCLRGIGPAKGGLGPLREPAGVLNAGHNDTRRSPGRSLPGRQGVRRRRSPAPGNASSDSDDSAPTCASGASRGRYPWEAASGRSLATRPADARPDAGTLCLGGDALRRLRWDRHSGQLGEPQPEALVADRRPVGFVWPLGRPQGGGCDRDGGLCQDSRGAGLPARIADAEADPVGEAGGHLEVDVTLELLQPLEGLGRAAVLQAEDDLVAGLLPPAEPVGLDDPVELACTMAL